MQQQQEEQLAKDIDALLEYHQIPACSVCVATTPTQNNQEGVVWNQAFGGGDGGGCTVDSQFHLFSGTKLYTAAAILKLAESGKLALSDSVTQHLPDDCFLLVDTDTDNNHQTKKRLDPRITIEHCLGHVTGLKDSPMEAWLSAHSTDPNVAAPTLLDCLQRFDFQTSGAPPAAAPAKYANLNYVLLGCVIEQVSGQTYQDHVQQAVLAPLGSRAGFSSSPVNRNHRSSLGASASSNSGSLVRGTIGFWNSIVAYFLLKREQYDMIYKDSKRIPRGRRGAGLCTLSEFDLDCVSIGGLVGSARDFAPLLVEVLRAHRSSRYGDGAPPRQQQKEHSQSSPARPAAVLSAASWNNMVAKHFDGQIGVHSKDGVGLAFKIGPDFVNHEGGGPGFTTESRCYLEDGIAIVIMMNKWSINFVECTVCHEICELIRKAIASIATK